MPNATVASMDRPTSAQRVLPITSGSTVHALTTCSEGSLSRHQRRPSLVEIERPCECGDVVLTAELAVCCERRGYLVPRSRLPLANTTPRSQLAALYSVVLATTWSRSRSLGSKPRSSTKLLCQSCQCLWLHNQAALSRATWCLPRRLALHSLPHGDGFDTIVSESETESGGTRVVIEGERMLGGACWR